MIYLRDTDKSRFFTMTKLNHELSFNPFDLAPGFYCLKAHESDSVVFFLHKSVTIMCGQNIICSNLDVISHEQVIICRQLLQVCSYQNWQGNVKHR